MSLELYIIAEDESSETLVSPKFLTSINTDTVQIGREPTAADGILIDSKTVSRVHGIFYQTNNHWFFKDLASSNGSWLNGKHLSADQSYLLRSGDELQLADTFLGIKLNSHPENVPSVIIFNRGEYNTEIAVPENGKFLSIGGAKSNLKLDIDLGSLPQFVMEVRNESLCIYPVSTDALTTVNSVTLENLVQLKDRDRVEISPYLLIVNNLSADSIAENKASTFSSWEEQEKAPKGHFFGRLRSDTDSGSFLDPAKVVSPGTRSGDKKELLGKLESLEEKFVVILGFILVFFILAAVIWWFLRE